METGWAREARGPERRSSGPAGLHKGINFFFRVSWIPPMVSSFLCQNIREYRQKLKKNQWYPGHKIKKYARDMLKSSFGNI